jgi:hypothetical protein
MDPSGRLITSTGLPHAVTTVIGKPELFCYRMPVKTDTVTHTAGIDFMFAGFRIQLQQGAMPEIRRQADIARHTDRCV